MAAKKEILFKARWGQAGKPSVASVDFYATNIPNAQRRADKIARDLGVTNTPRTLQQGSQVVEVLSRGVTSDA